MTAPREPLDGICVSDDIRKADARTGLEEERTISLGIGLPYEVEAVLVRHRCATMAHCGVGLDLCTVNNAIGL
jgi:hypothetical protein